MKTKIDRTPGFRTLPDGIYDARFIKREDLEELGIGEMIRWVFEIEYDGELYEMSGVSSKKFSLHPNCKAWQWARAVDPELNAEAEEWDDENAVGNWCAVELANVDRRGNVFTNVVNVLPLDQSKKGGG